jgi:hypothetical protein
VGGVLVALIIITIIVSFLIYKLRTDEKPINESEWGRGDGAHGVYEGSGQLGEEMRAPKSADQDVNDGGRLGQVYLHTSFPGEETGVPRPADQGVDDGGRLGKPYQHKMREGEAMPE